MNQQSEYLRQKVWFIINTIQANQLFVHSSQLEIKFPKEEQAAEGDTEEGKKAKKTKGFKAGKIKIITQNLPEILTICVLNALVPNSAMLLMGGHGGGKTSIVKYLARMFTSISLSEAEECILRAHPQLTEEKVIASLDFPLLMKEGKQKVIWRKFAVGFWKIIDEVNRTSPYTQNILLSLLAEGKIKYYDEVLDVSKYCLYATLNPQDAGTFELSPPFLDRFGISVPISMPKSQDLAIILEGNDEKLSGYDELVQVPKVLTTEQLMAIWYEVRNTPCTLDAENFIHAIIRDYTLCQRIDKGNSDHLKPNLGLCTGCHFNIPEKIPCCNVDSILSVRVAKDLLRYARALTWLLGLSEVTIPMVQAVAPYVIAHRVVYLERILNQDPFWGNKLEFTKKMMDLILKRFNSRQKAYEFIRDLRQGDKSAVNMVILQDMAKNDLIVSMDLYPLAEALADDRYQKMVTEIAEAEHKQDIEKITKLRSNLLQTYDFPNRGELISRLNVAAKTLTETTYNCTLAVWQDIRMTIDGLFPEFSAILKDSTKQRKSYILRSEDFVLEINITGTDSHDVVNFSFYGGAGAKKLKESIEKRHKNALKSIEELMAESEKAKATIENMKQTLKTDIGKKNSKEDDEINKTLAEIDKELKNQT